MKNITIGSEVFGFTKEILMKHLRKIQPLTIQLENKEISELDFFIKMAVALCDSPNKDILEKCIDNLDMGGVEKFTKDFQPLLKKLEDFSKNQDQDKKK